MALLYKIEIKTCHDFTSTNVKLTQIQLEITTIYYLKMDLDTIDWSRN